MSHPLNANDFEVGKKADLCPWFHAYVALRKAVYRQEFAAAPVTALKAVTTVVEDQLCRDLDVPLTSVLGLLRAYDEWLAGSQDGQDQAAIPTA